MSSLLESITPWRAVTQGRARFALVIWLLGLVATLILMVCFQGQGHHHMAAAWLWIMLYSLWLIFTWAVFPASSLLLAVDGQRLQIPGMVRRAFTPLIPFAVLCIAPPALLGQWQGLPGWQIAMVLSCAALGGLLFSWLPRYLTAFVWIAFSFARGSHLGIYISLPGHPDSAKFWAALLLVLAVVAAGLAWRYLRRGLPETGWLAPIVVQSRCNGGGMSWGGIGSRQRLMQTPKWFRPLVDLTSVGPGHPRSSVRVALGGWYTPMKAQYYLRQFSLALLIPVAISVTNLVAIRHHQAIFSSDFFTGMAVGFGSSLLPMIAVGTSAASIILLRRRWNRGSNELALLALLPGLGAGLPRQVSVALACLRLPWAIHAIAVGLILVAMAIWPSLITGLALALPLQLTAVAATSAGILFTIREPARRQQAWPRSVLIAVLALALLLLGTALPLIALSAIRDHSPPTSLGPWIAGYLLLSALALVTLLVKAWRYWQQLQQQPHPFLGR